MNKRAPGFLQMIGSKKPKRTRHPDPVIGASSLSRLNWREILYLAKKFLAVHSRACTRGISGRGIKLLIILALSFYLTLFREDISADSNFTTDLKAEYKIHETGVTSVTKTISVSNNHPTISSRQFVLIVNNLDLEGVKAYEASKELPVRINKQPERTEITVEFDDVVVGKGSTRTFLITYEERRLAVKTGEVWEVSIPKVVNPGLFDVYRVSLSVPESFGDPGYISPNPAGASHEAGRNIFVFNKGNLRDSGISAGFGKSQVFNFSLNYHIENSENSESLMEIALPPDTNLQRVYYTDINPIPENVVEDSDGNWIALFRLKPKEKIDVLAKGHVQVFAEPIKTRVPSPVALLSNLEPTKYWESDSPEIIQIAQNLKNPKEIYDFVVDYLNYNYDRVNPDTERLGALEAIKNPNSAICTEFTDLFIALARARGIPAREINGYAYTENPMIQPLSLVSDVLHAWPEYWDQQTNRWVSVDPTWGSTTGGLDFFSKLDLRHFTFVIHGKDSEKPHSPGLYKTGKEPKKDVFVEFGEINQIKDADLEIVPPVRSAGITIFKENLTIDIVNNGPSAVYDLQPEVNFSDQKITDFIPILPPYARHPIRMEIKHGLFSSNSPDSFSVVLGDKTQNFNINKTGVIINQLIAVLLTIMILLLVTHPKWLPAWVRRAKNLTLKRD